jgi:hypothetical protein
LPLSRRYTPEHPPGESCTFGLDYSFILPVGVVIEQGTIAVQTNTATPVDASADWTIGPVGVTGRKLWARLAGGVLGKDYKIIWTAIDSAGNTWPRSTLVLCADTS